MGCAELGGLREALQRFDVSLVARAPAAPFRLEAEKKRLDERLGAAPERAPPGDLLAATYETFRAMASRDEDLSGLSAADLRRVPWVLFAPIRSDLPPLADNATLVDTYLRELVRRQSPSAVSALMAAFLWVYPVDHAVFQRVRGVLARELLPQARGSRNARWRASVAGCGLLDEGAPARLAGRLTQGPQDAVTVLTDCCLTGVLANGGLVERAYLEWVQSMRARLVGGWVGDAEIERLLRFSADPMDPRKLRYEAHRIALAEGLLTPFAVGTPGTRAADVIKAFLLEVLGDPRLTGARRWSGIDERARGVMYQWLVTTTLEDFFRLLEYAAQSDATAARHWCARKAFWSRYLKAGHIRDAWVALGPVTQVDAREFLSSEGRAYAVLERGYLVQPNHSAIIMRVGDVTITEWSHSGKFRLWLPENRDGPPLYRSRYTRDLLVRNPSEEITHAFNWQGRVSDLLYYHTGVSA